MIFCDMNILTKALQLTSTLQNDDEAELARYQPTLNLVSGHEGLKAIGLFVVLRLKIVAIQCHGYP